MAYLYKYYISNVYSQLCDSFKLARLDLEYVMTDSILLTFSFIDNKLYEASGFFLVGS